jgi:hypothetical protein
MVRLFRELSQASEKTEWISQEKRGISTTLLDHLVTSKSHKELNDFHSEFLSPRADDASRREGKAWWGKAAAQWWKTRGKFFKALQKFLLIYFE